jgi:RNA polymerase sigma factor (sigma-70 family)
MDEIALIRTSLQGDLEAFNFLVLEHQDFVYRRAFWLLREREAAQDATQEAFIKAFQNMSRFRGGSFRAWILRIVTNVCYDDLRRKNRQRMYSLFGQDPNGEESNFLDFLIDPTVSTEESIEQIELRATLKDQIQQLPEEYRETLVLVDLMELTYKEAAQIQKVPIGTIKSRLARARDRLRIQLLMNPDHIAGLYASEMAHVAS